MPYVCPECMDEYSRLRADQLRNQRLIVESERRLLHLRRQIEIRERDFAYQLDSVYDAMAIFQETLEDSEEDDMEPSSGRASPATVVSNSDSSGSGSLGVDTTMPALVPLRDPVPETGHNAQPASNEASSLTVTTTVEGPVAGAATGGGGVTVTVTVVSSPVTGHVAETAPGTNGGVTVTVAPQTVTGPVTRTSSRPGGRVTVTVVPQTVTGPVAGTSSGTNDVVITPAGSSATFIGGSPYSQGSISGSSNHWDPEEWDIRRESWE
ncbi:hypothetical protein E8E14_009825 [Neopestalotiopsis sp. 37M]|nr:hypothetical protein E8E14_009825 [Neopestalotiopsis sp. 37M]